jgi:hypothetical protein
MASLRASKEDNGINRVRVKVKAVKPRSKPFSALYDYCTKSARGSIYVDV